MTTDKNSVVRLISLLKMLAQTPGSVAYFANFFGVDERTIRRDLLSLQNAGFPIVLNRSTGRMELVSDYGVPSIELTEREALATIFLFQEFGRQIEGPLFSTLRNAAAKLTANLSPLLLESLETTTPKVFLRVGETDVNESARTDDEQRRRDGNGVFVGKVASGRGLKSDALVGSDSDEDSETLERRRRCRDAEQKFETILNASVDRRPLEVRYESPVESEFTTTLHPYATFFSRAWYVVGFSTLHREIRTFKISRFTQMEASNEKFRENDCFSLDAYFGSAWRFVRGQRIYCVVVRFSPKVAVNVAEVRWHKSQKTRFLDDGRVELTFEVAGLSEIIWWILGYGPEAEVVEPSELRRQVADSARKMLEIYRDDFSK